MNTYQSFAMPTQAEIDKHIAEARKMRSDYIVQSVKSGLVWLRSQFSRKSFTNKATA